MAKIVKVIGLAITSICCVFLSCASRCAGAEVDSLVGKTDAIISVVHAVGISQVKLPAGVTKDNVDGIVVERNGQCVPVDYSISGSDLAITPCNDFEGGAIYDVKVFIKNGKRHLIKLQVEPYSKFNTNRESVVRIPAKPSKGFSYAYVLYVPSGIDKLKDRRLIVNCNNTQPSTLRQYFEDGAEKQASGNTVTLSARQLQIPVLVPAFPREYYRGDDGYIYPQILDSAAVKKDRADKQLVAMIKDAQKELEYNGISVADKVFIYGFSTDGKFAQRFTVLHPDIVMAGVAGAIAGTTTYPISEFKGERLNYPVGVADIKELMGIEFNKDEYLRVPQFFFMGATDSNDVTEWIDCFRRNDSEQIWRLFGKNQIPDRWTLTQKVLADAAPGIQCKTYPGVGHTLTSEIRTDVMNFYKDHWTR